ncbi:MAG TPA: hypothetical protein VGY54_11460 [Polyangiaceae bacterium]|jgi:hypothetical protein|nr:hypothetical protein [Polyangiaceae bacterium]
MKTGSILVAVASGLALLLARDANALGPVDVEVAARVGGGTSPVNSSASSSSVGSLDINPLGFGVGGRAGVSFFNVYAGLSLMYYFGGSKDVPIPPMATVHESATSLLYGAEIGYDIGLPVITVRPQVGVGRYTLNVDGSANVCIPGFPCVQANGSSTWDNVYVEPGIMVKASFGSWLVGADANLFWLPGSDKVDLSLCANPACHYTLSSQLAFTAHGQVGLQF